MAADEMRRGEVWTLAQRMMGGLQAHDNSARIANLRFGGMEQPAPRGALYDTDQGLLSRSATAKAMNR